MIDIVVGKPLVVDDWHVDVELLQSFKDTAAGV